MTLVLVDDGRDAMTVARVPEGEARREDRLRDMLFVNPEMLPIRELEPGIGTLVPVARELYIAGVGRLDCLLCDSFGRLVIVECKLWRNPQARREVVGQILDYARALSRFGYEDLQRVISATTGEAGNVLFARARAAGGTLGEAAFVDRVARDLAAGRFLLMIVGDGIAEGTQQIVEYLQDQPGLAFGFALVEMAEYRFRDPVLERERTIVHPRLLAKTVEHRRIVIRSEVPATVIGLEQPLAAPAPSGGGTTTAEAPPVSERSLQWRAFAERLNGIRFDDPGQMPPRNGGVGWMRVPLPGPAHITLWRGTAAGEVGAFARFGGAEGLTVYELLESERATIDQEFAQAKLPSPIWSKTEVEASIALQWPAPMPWGEAEEDTQLHLLSRAANQFVNSLRPRLLALAFS